MIEAALVDWVKALGQYPQDRINAACDAWLANGKRRPTPADIIERMTAKQADGNRADLTPEKRQILEERILPTARKHLNVPSLADSARKTLEYWGEAV